LKGIDDLGDVVVPSLSSESMSIVAVIEDLDLGGETTFLLNIEAQTAPESEFDFCGIDLIVVVEEGVLSRLDESKISSDEDVEEALPGAGEEFEGE